TDLYQKTIDSINAEQSNYLLMIQIKNTIFPYMVLMEMEKILDQIKQENQMVHISDFNKIISKEIAQESAPYIYERIGNRYQHYLLDEFQDTSVIQWHNLLPLIENSLSENFDNLIVGDSKQAIYRWRGSEVEQFSKLPELISEHKDQLLLQREQMLKNNYAERQLNTNYRSEKTIINFNNKLFQYIKDHGYIDDAYLSIYDNHWQESKKTDETGMAEIHFVTPPPKSDKELYLEHYNQRTYEIILSANKKKYKYKDMAVLARSNTDINSLAQYLLAKNIPIVSSESLFVDTSPQVQFMLSIIKHVLQPKEYVYQVEIIRYLLENDRLDGVQIDSLSTELASLNPKDELNKYWQLLGIELDKPYLIAKEAYDAIELIARLFGVDTNESLTHFFIEASFIFTKENHQGLSDFLIFWDLKSKDYKLDVPEDWDAVRLMSFHKAKGLEFPVVINWFSQKLSPNKAGKSTVWINPELKKFPDLVSYPFVLSKLKETSHHDFYETEINKSVLDEINLFYVANTRPTEKLYVLVDDLPKNEPTGVGVHFNMLMNGFVTSEKMTKIDDYTFRIGEDQEKENAKNEEASSDDMLILKTHITSDWNESMTLALENETERNEMAAWGQKVHLVLAEINTKDDIDMAFKRLVYKGVIDDGEQEIINELVLQVINCPQLKAYYQADVQVYNERDMVDEHGGIIRPDRLVIVNGLAVVIDYKTGVPKKKDEDQINNYCTQVGNHLKVDVSGYLVYLHEEITIEETKKLYHGK
ncbi:MAG: UvrD-helicase domain-containing protein, partial [Bacteroidales bacterium]|nr:UvrD-helicase domain-containing protein [Bacteroidales bacterium]